MRYVRDVPRDDEAALAVERVHVRDHLAAVADADDDPATRAGAVQVWTVEHPDDPTLLRIVGELSAEPTAPYLDPDYDPFAGLPPELLAEARNDG